MDAITDAMLLAEPTEVVMKIYHAHDCRLLMAYVLERLSSQAFDTQHQNPDDIVVYCSRFGVLLYLLCSARPYRRNW